MPKGNGLMKILVTEKYLKLIPETGDEHVAIDEAIKHSVKNGWNTFSHNTKSDRSGERVWSLEIETV